MSPAVRRPLRVPAPPVTLYGMGKRDSSIDAVRVLGIVAIVFGHIIATDPVRMALYTWHVPVFFFLSGWLWSPGRSVTEEVRRRSLTLLRPYVFWLAVLLAAVTVRGTLDGTLSWQAILTPVYGGAVAGRPFSTFWFVFVLFASAVLWRLLERVPLAVRVAVIVAGVAAAVFLGPELARTPLAVGSALPALAFLGAGQMARSYRNSGVAAAVLAAAGILIVLRWSAPLDIKQGDWGTPVVSMIVAAAISWALVVLADPIVSRLPERVGAGFTSFALVGFTVVLAHPAVLWLVSGWGLPRPAVFLLAVGVPALVGAAALRTPLSGWVTGVSARRRTRSPDTPDAQKALG